MEGVVGLTFSAFDWGALLGQSVCRHPKHARAARPIFRIKFAPGDYVAAIAMNARIIRTSVRWLTQTTVSSISIT